MKRNSRLSVALHSLIHLAESRDEPATSERLAACLCTNPVVVRRTMAGLRIAGLVRSAPGHGGGWTLMHPLGSISLRDVYLALGEATLVARGNHAESRGCLLEQAVSDVLDDSFRIAEASLVERLGETTLANLAAAVKRLKRQRKNHLMRHVA